MDKQNRNWERAPEFKSPAVIWLTGTKQLKLNTGIKKHGRSHQTIKDAEKIEPRIPESIGTAVLRAPLEEENIPEALLKAERNACIRTSDSRTLMPSMARPTAAPVPSLAPAASVHLWTSLGASCAVVGHRTSISGVEACLTEEAAWGGQVRESGRGVLLLWRGGPAAVVLGRSQAVEKEVDPEACRHYGVPVFRRTSGGGAVLQTEGVLNYSLLFPDRNRLSVNAGFRMGTWLVQEALRRLGLESTVQGVSDVTVNGRKVSGNAIARVNRVFLVHGTLLADMDKELLEACLRHPSREPDYRAGRSHREFLTTLADLGVTAHPGIDIAWEDAAKELFGRLEGRGIL